jgi:hypothetical protein
MEKNTENLQEATEQEAAERRQFLIDNGTITLTPNQNNQQWRNELVKSGTIKPIERLPNGRITYVPLAPSRRIKSTNREEGEYTVKPILSDADYERRKKAYFRSLQELLFSRRDLNLIVGKKNDNDPEWYF